MEIFSIVLSITCLFTLYSFGLADEDKRFVAEIDVVQELAKLTKQLEEQRQQIENNTKTLAEKEKEIESLRKSSRSSYTRWGRTTCPHNDTELVYHGYMGASQYNANGGGANYLCLSPDPQWSYYDESIASYAEIRGVEYEFYGYHGHGIEKFFGKEIYNDDAVCAVCSVPRGTNIMIPGRTECYGGWTKEYSGYLVSNQNGGGHATDFICLDDRPEAVVGGKTDDDEGLMYFVEGACGKSLECPPYIQGRELTCVICSK